MRLDAVVVFAPPRREIHWLRPASVEAPEEPPATIELGGATFVRRGRVPVTVEAMGQGVPPLGETAIWAAYDGAGRDVAVVLASRGALYGWSGRRYDEGEYDRLGGADV
jgi:hypothetical protein